MREIKFRAWKKTNTPEMFKNVTSVDFKKNVVGLDYKVSSWTLREDTESLDNVILMQYTGLTDKNGVEIYEGDVVEYIHGCRFEVVFKEYSFGWLEDGFIPFTNMAKSEFSKFEVIGNIYENPEISETKKSS